MAGGHRPVRQPPTGAVREAAHAPQRHQERLVLMDTTSRCRPSAEYSLGTARIEKATNQGRYLFWSYWVQSAHGQRRRTPGRALPLIAYLPHTHSPFLERLRPFLRGPETAQAYAGDG